MLKFLSVSLVAALAIAPAQDALAGAKSSVAGERASVGVVLEAKAAKKDTTAGQERKAQKKAERAARKAKKKLARAERRAARAAKSPNPNWSDEHAAFVDQARNTDSGHGNGGETPDFENGGWKPFPSESLDRDPANSRLQCQGGKNPNRC